MIREAKNVEFELIETTDPFSRYREDIERVWKKHCLEDPSAYSEKVLNLFDTEETETGMKLRIGWINFYEAFYSKTVGNIQTRNLFSGGYILTCDGYYCLAVDWDDQLNLVGGVASRDDFEDGQFVPERCLIRESKEEMGIDITEEHFRYELKYLKINAKDENYFPVGILYEVRTDYSKKELEEMFANSAHDNELQTLKFIRLDDPDKSVLHTRRKYIIELFDQIRLKEEQRNDHRIFR